MERKCLSRSKKNPFKWHKDKIVFRNLKHYKFIFGILGPGRRIPESQKMKWRKRELKGEKGSSKNVGYLP